MLRTTKDITDEFRSDVWDQPDVDADGSDRDSLWSDDEILRYINSACARLASDTLALRRRFSITVLAGDPMVRFPYEEVLDDLQVSFVVPGLGRRRGLHQFDLNDGIAADDYGHQIYTFPDLDAVGMPTHFTRDYDNTYMRLWKIPHVSGVLDAHAIMLPATLYSGMMIPFAARSDIDLLLMWMKHLAYAKQDADVLDLSRSTAFGEQYMAMVRDRKSEIDRVRRDGGIVRPS